MDPNACVTLIVEALNDKKRLEAEEHAENLLGWLGRQGFEPRRSSASEIVNALVDVFDADECPTVCALLDELRQRDMGAE